MSINGWKLRLFENSITPVSLSTEPGVPTPITLISSILTPASSTAASIALFISSKISSAGLGALVLTEALPIMLQSESTTPTDIFVPPKSTPIRYINIPPEI